MKLYLGRPREVEVEIYDACKYTSTEAGKRIRYNNVVAFEGVHGQAATLLEDETDDSGIDEFHEYLVLYFTNGETATFRNSHADLFII